MSVSLQINYRDSNHQARLVPIATEQDFEKYWLPLCSKLDLEWISFFQSGLPLAKDNISLVVKELTSLKRFLSTTSNSDLPHDVSIYIVRRTDNLLVELKQIQKTPGLEAYIS